MWSFLLAGIPKFTPTNGKHACEEYTTTLWLSRTAWETFFFLSNWNQASHSDLPSSSQWKEQEIFSLNYPTSRKRKGVYSETTTGNRELRKFICDSLSLRHTIFQFPIPAYIYPWSRKLMCDLQMTKVTQGFFTLLPMYMSMRNHNNCAQPSFIPESAILQF